MLSVSIQFDANKEYLFKQIIEAMFGEGGDGWVWVTHPNYREFAQQLFRFIENNREYGKFRLKFEHHVKFGHYASLQPVGLGSQEYIHITERDISLDNKKCYAFVFEIEEGVQ